MLQVTFAFLITVFTSISSLHASETDYPLMSYEEYIVTRRPSPYTFIASKSGQQLFYFGANHSWDPNNEQYELLEKMWQHFLDVTGGQNCVVFVEGSLRYLYDSKTKEEAIRRAGSEGGYITFLAAQHDMPIVCPEPDTEWLMNELSKTFSREAIAYRFFAQAALDANRKSHSNKIDKADFIERCLLARQRFFDFPLTLDQMKKINLSLFSSPGAYERTILNIDDEEFFYDITNPATKATLINAICRQASRLRDMCILSDIHKRVQKGKNIFIVYGRTHAIMQEQALRKMMVDKR